MLTAIIALKLAAYCLPQAMAADSSAERQTYIEFRVVGKDSSDKPITRKLWRVGKRLARVEITPEKGGPQIFIINTPYFFTGNTPGKPQIRYEDVEAAAIPAMFTEGGSEAAGTLEIGSELQFFKDARAARGPNKEISGKIYYVFEFRNRGTVAKLYVDSVSRTPHRLNVKSPDGQYSIQYLKYERGQPVDESLYALPGNMGPVRSSWGNQTRRLASVLGGDQVGPLGIFEEDREAETTEGYESEAPIENPTNTAPGSPVYVEYEYLFDAKIKLKGKSMSTGTGLRKVWRIGDKKARIEEPVVSATAASGLLIFNEGEIFAGDMATMKGQHIKNAEPGLLVPVFPLGVPGALAGIEIGREIEFFKKEGGQFSDAMLQGRRHAVLRVSEIGVEASLYIDRKTGVPSWMRLKEDGGLTYWVRYAKYERLASLEPKLFEAPPGMKLVVADASVKSDDTPFEGQREEYRRFALIDTKTRFVHDEMACWNRPGLLYFFDVNGDKSLDEARRIFSKYKKTPLCLFLIPVGGSDLDLGVVERAESMRRKQSSDYPWFIPPPHSQLGAIRGPAAILIHGDGAEIGAPLRDGIPDPDFIDAALSKALHPDLPAADDIRARDAKVDRAELNNEAGAARIRRLLEDRKFEELDLFFAGLRSKKARASTGAWPLRSNYQFLSENDGTEESIHERMVLLDQWIRSRPRSITPRVALGSLWRQYAWLGRGGGYANQLTKEQKNSFRDRLGRARDVLSAARKLDEKCPELYAQMLAVAKGERLKKEEALEVFKEGRALQPSYPYLYEAMSQFLVEKWGGKPGEWEEFLEDAVNQNIGGVGAEMYARVAFLLMGSGEPEFGRYGSGLFKNTRLSWEIVKRGAQDVAVRFPGSKYNFNQIAMLACMAGDRETAHDMMEIIAEDYAVGVWGNRVNFELARRWANRSPTPGSRLRKKS